jgi:hypothetical protein
VDVAAVAAVLAGILSAVTRKGSKEHILRVLIWKHRIRKLAN